MKETLLVYLSNINKVENTINNIRESLKQIAIGKVIIDKRDNRIYLTESGYLHIGFDKKYSFSNNYLFIFDNNIIGLSHWRNGRNNPVKLVDLIYCGNRNCWISKKPHKCGSDSYSARIILDNDDAIITVRWQIIGLKKNINIIAKYT